MSELSIEEKNKALILSLFEGINNRNIEIFNKLLSTDFVRYSHSIPPDPEKIEGIENYKNFIMGALIAFPDYKEELQEIIAEGDKVAIITKGTGTHTGPLGEVVPSNKEYVFITFIVFRIKENKIAQMRVCWNNVVLLELLGLFPCPEKQDSE